MRILYLCQRIPFRPDRGDRIAAFHQIRHLLKKHDLVVGSLAHQCVHEEKEAFMSQFGPRIIAPDHCRIKQAAGMIGSFLGGEPLSLGYFRNSSLKVQIERVNKIKPFDAAIVFSSSMAQYVQGWHHIPRIMHFCDVDSQKWVDLAKERRGLMRLIYQREGRVLLAYEKKIAAEFSASCVVTNREAELFRRYVSESRVYVLENGVNIEYFSAVPRKPEGLQFLFLGVMDYPPNIEAVTYFAKKIWPDIIRRYPKARFRIVGARPSQAVLRLAQTAGIEVTGYVPDVRPYFSTATMMLAPIGVARGIQNKILEAMAAGVPVLTTPVVSKGLPDREMVFTVERDSFASALDELIKNAVLREAKGAEAQEYVRRFCTWAEKHKSLDALLEEVSSKNKSQ
jgi:polysaccharide biosynthesis protein PslH